MPHVICVFYQNVYFLDSTINSAYFMSFYASLHIKISIRIMDGVPSWNNIVVFANYVNTTTTKELTTAVFAVYSGRYSIAL